MLIALQLTGCSAEYFNRKIEPVSAWYESEYEATRYTHRYKFTKSDIDSIRAAVVSSVPKLGVTISALDPVIVGTGVPGTMFTPQECEEWKNIDNDKTTKLSDGLLTLSCDPKKTDTIIVMTIGMKKYPSGTLVVLDYEMKNPTIESYGVISPRRPPPAASKLGSAKFWNLLNEALPYPIYNATKEDLK